MEHTSDTEKKLEEHLSNMQPSPSPRFYRRMARAAWTPATFVRQRTLAAAGLALALALALLIFTPQGRAWAQQALHFFTRSPGDTMPAPTMPTMRWVNQTPGSPAPTLTAVEPSLPAFYADCGDIRHPGCTFAQIREKVKFTIKQLGMVPKGLFFTGATGGTDGIELSYDSVDHSGFIYIREAPWTNSPKQTTWQVGASAVIETVQIGALSGEYVRGTFMMKAGDSVAVWDGDADEQTMHWVDGGVFYVMQTGGSVFPLDRQALVALAESLTTGPLAAALTPLPPTPTSDMFDIRSMYPLTLAHAEGQAGFNVLTPTKLPEVLSFIGAKFDAQSKLVRLFYLLDQALWGPNENGLTLSEQLAPNPADCALCGFKVGDINDVWADDTGSIVGAIQAVQIGGAPGQYVEGNWEGKNDQGIWAWTPDPQIKRLRWQANGMAFELSYLGTEINQTDLIAIAESLK